MKAAMRPAKTSQGTLVAPLNRILGTEAHVRLLRILSRASGPLSRPELARYIRLDESGVRRALDALGVEGIVEAVEGGGHMRMRLRDAHPLAAALRALFEAEGKRAQEIIYAIRRKVRTLSRRPEAMWIMMTGRRHPDALDVVRVSVLAYPRDVDALARELRLALREVERAHDVVIEVTSRTAADLETVDAQEYADVMEALAVVGPKPGVYLPDEPPAETAPKPAPPRGRWRTHAELDRRALALGRAIGDRLVRDPSLIDRARGYVRRRLTEAAPGERQEMEEWDGILDTMPPARLRAFLTDPGERATRLRQSLPFVDVLSASEREAVFRKAGA
jgi:DNA-binding transcriptional ArsR family regulator